VPVHAQDSQGSPALAGKEQFATIDLRDATAPASEFDRFQAAARRDGRVRVIAGLRIAFKPEGALAAGRRDDQRRGIEDATASVRHALRGTPHRVIHTYRSVPYIALELSEAALARLESTGAVASLERDALSSPTLAQSTRIVEATESKGLGRAGTGQVVAILDTGVAKTHPFLQHSPGVSKVLSEACYSANGDCPGSVTASTATGSGVNCTYAASGCRHGTHVAGIAAGKGSSFSGVASAARLISIQVFSRFTGGSCAGAGEDPCALSFTSDQLAGLDRVFALRNTFHIAAANMSLGGGNFTSNCDADSRKAAIDNLRSAGIATVISSGNDGFTNAVGAPACISTAVTVGSTNDSDTVSLFSNSSTLVDFFAPGEGITSSVPQGTGPGGSDFDTFNGTSMAAPHVAGAWAIAKQVRPTATVSAVESALNATGKPITDSFASPQITRDRIRVLSAGAHLKQTGFRSNANWSGPGLNLASDGVGLARRTGANVNPTSPPVNASFNLVGIPPGATIRRAYVVYQTVGGPDPTFTFEGTSRTAQLVGASGQYNCWTAAGVNNGGAVRTYRYLVPAGQVTGNGVYDIGGVGGTLDPVSGRPDGQGASLVVVYQGSPGTPTGRAYLRFGSLTARPGAPAMSHTFTGLSVPGPTSSRTLHVGIGDGQPSADPAMRFQGSAITPANFWSGSEGTYWDDARIPLSAALLPPGTTTRTNAQGASADCLTWGYAGLRYRD
jgi:subtilisin